MFQNGTLIMGLVLFCLRLLFCVIFLMAENRFFNLFDHELAFPPWAWAIILGIGALTDLILIVGVLRKNISAIKFWNISQVFIGGLLFIMIFLLTMKTIQEIKDERKPKKQEIYTISYTRNPRPNHLGSENSLNSNVTNHSTCSTIPRGAGELKSSDFELLRIIWPSPIFLNWWLFFFLKPVIGLP